MVSTLDFDSNIPGSIPGEAKPPEVLFVLQGAFLHLIFNIVLY
tara:strand:+ start:1802 stop:1930 length:129 start_codon:yes stop_codon:yes gene_type:complete